MTPVMMRHLWDLIERTQTAILLNLDDTSLVNWLIGQMRSELPLNQQEADVFSSYIRSRTSLIRDTAMVRDAALSH